MANSGSAVIASMSVPPQPQPSQSWTPHPYQLKGVKHLLERGGGGLFFKPGFGKTSTVYAALLVLFQTGKAKRVLILAPLRVARHVWPAERDKWTDFNGLRVVVLHGDRKDELLEQDADIYCLNYEGLDWFTRVGGFAKLGADTLVCDESTKLKNGRSKRFLALKLQLNTFKRRWILTGTPSPNGLVDLWAQMFLVDGGLALGRFVTHFKAMYFTPSGYMGYDLILNPGAEDAIHARIRPYIYEMSDTDYLDLPDLVYTNIMVDLPPAARKAYNTMEDDFVLQLGEETFSVAANAAVAGGKCRQIANGALYSNPQESEYVEYHDAKLDALEDMIDELAGSPALVVYEFIHDRERILKRLGDRAAHLGSGGSEKKEAALIARFNAGDLPALVVHPASAGHGLNLQQAAAHVIMFGVTWNLEYYEQVMDRIFRQGNPNKRVVVAHIVARKTLDEKVLKVLTGKDRTQKKLFKALRD